MFPTQDLDVFTLGLLPTDELSLRFFILGIEEGLKRIGFSASEIVAFTGQAVQAVLNQHIINNKQQLDSDLSREIIQHIPLEQAQAWRLPSPYGPNQILGEALVSFALRPVSLQRLICFAPRRGNEASFVQTDQWLGTPLSEGNPAQAKQELLRRYLHCYGPSTLQHFSEWAGISPAQADPAWKALEPELVAINLMGKNTWLHQQDIPQLQSAGMPCQIHFLPPHDPYLLLRDRETLVPEKALQQLIWRRVGNPGIVLVDGRLTAAWRPNKQGKRLKINVTFFLPQTEKIRKCIETEASTLAAFRDCSAVEVVFSDTGTL